MRRILLTSVTTLLLLTGCSSGGDSDGGSADGGGNSAPTSEPSSSPSATSDAQDGPACEDVWQAGATLPADYTSCV
jgi:hypothetical protein